LKPLGKGGPFPGGDREHQDVLSSNESGASADVLALLFTFMSGSKRAIKAIADLF